MYYVITLDLVSACIILEDSLRLYLGNLKLEPSHSEPYLYKSIVKCHVEKNHKTPSLLFH